MKVDPFRFISYVFTVTLFPEINNYSFITLTFFMMDPYIICTYSVHDYK